VVTQNVPKGLAAPSIATAANIGPKLTYPQVGIATNGNEHATAVFRWCAEVRGLVAGAREAVACWRQLIAEIDFALAEQVRLRQPNEATGVTCGLPRRTTWHWVSLAGAFANAHSRP
jgi:hypothetical protein